MTLGNVQVCSLDSYCTDLHRCPAGSQSGALAVACTDGVHTDCPPAAINTAACCNLLTPSVHAGSFSLFNASGRRDKQVKAHKGAVTSLHWNLEGMQALCL